MQYQESAIRMEVFVSELIRQMKVDTVQKDSMQYGYEHGWLTDLDMSERKMPLQKKHCARIVHEFLRVEKKEADEIDSGPAGRLQDLFDCRVCAGHIMQVYTKGIMDGYMNPEDRYVFGTEDMVTDDAAKEIIRRIFCTEFRTKPESPSGEKTAERISLEEATSLLRDGSNILLVDVRSEYEYQEWHLRNARSCPMTEILKNPYAVCERRDVLILLYCEKGYMSEAAAQSLSRAGYEKVSYFACGKGS